MKITQGASFTVCLITSALSQGISVSDGTFFERKKTRYTWYLVHEQVNVNLIKVMQLFKRHILERLRHIPGVSSQDTHTPYHRDPVQIMEECNGMFG